jgi:Zn ribbon nucleic-acid-binding protein
MLVRMRKGYKDLYATRKTWRQILKPGFLLRADELLMMPTCEAAIPESSSIWGSPNDLSYSSKTVFRFCHCKATLFYLREDGVPVARCVEHDLGWQSRTRPSEGYTQVDWETWNVAKVHQA